MPFRAFLLALLALAAVPFAPAAPFLAQGTLAGEPRPDAVILQTRLTATPGTVDRDVPGAAGEVRFELSAAADFSRPIFTAWQNARAENDFIVQTRVTGLQPHQVYHYRAHYGAARASAVAGPAATFRTLAAPEANAPVRFVLLTCMHYARFFGHMQKGPQREMPAAERALGYPGLDAVREFKPDFWISNGDNVYYDHPDDSQALELPQLRQRWHEQGALARLVRLNGASAAFYLKDDHDFRYDDADLLGARLPGAALGQRTFREQVPLIDPATPAAPTYRTVRAGRDLQLWFLEGRDYRSPNREPDGPGKSIWGAEQRAWLQRTLKASDAAFKIIVSPTPLVGPDDARKRDNHTNLGGFRHEGTAFLEWLKAEHFDPSGLLILTGDRHWKYRSVHPTGFEEWAAGSIIYENARTGRAPGDPQSTDPEARIRQMYTDAAPLGGFLTVEVARSAAGRPQAVLTLRDEAGRPVHSHTHLR